MAIKTETFYINDKEFTRTYSDDNRYVVRGDEQYVEACDPAELHRVYTEGEPIPVDNYEAEMTATEVLNILFGGEEI